MKKIGLIFLLVISFVLMCSCENGNIVPDTTTEIKETTVETSKITEVMPSATLDATPTDTSSGLTTWRLGLMDYAKQNGEEYFEEKTIVEEGIKPITVEILGQTYTCEYQKTIYEAYSDCVLREYSILDIHYDIQPSVYIDSNSGKMVKCCFIPYDTSIRLSEEGCINFIKQMTGEIKWDDYRYLCSTDYMIESYDSNGVRYLSHKTVKGFKTMEDGEEFDSYRLEFRQLINGVMTNNAVVCIFNKNNFILFDYDYEYDMEKAQDIIEKIPEIESNIYSQLSEEVAGEIVKMEHYMPYMIQKGGKMYMLYMTEINYVLDEDSCGLPETPIYCELYETVTG